MSQERERARARARVGKGKGKRKRKGQGKQKGKGESTIAQAILFINRLGQADKSANYTVLYGKSGIVCS